MAGCKTCSGHCSLAAATEALGGTDVGRGEEAQYITEEYLAELKAEMFAAAEARHARRNQRAGSISSKTSQRSERPGESRSRNDPWFPRGAWERGNERFRLNEATFPQTPLKEASIMSKDHSPHDLSRGNVKRRWMGFLPRAVFTWTAAVLTAWCCGAVVAAEDPRGKCGRATQPASQGSGDGEPESVAAVLDQGDRRENRQAAGIHERSQSR